MNRVTTTVIAILGMLLIVFFFMWRNVSLKNAELVQQNGALTAQIEKIETTLVERDKMITAQNKKYNELLNSIQYNDCENLPVSSTLLKAAKELQE